MLACDCRSDPLSFSDVISRGASMWDAWFTVGWSAVVTYPASQVSKAGAWMPFCVPATLPVLSLRPQRCGSELTGWKPPTVEGGPSSCGGGAAGSEAVAACPSLTRACTQQLLQRFFPLVLYFICLIFIYVYVLH